jgi:predicted unusual protein kinase regulating ubiquinone biosynthesis (AarF/ABC1/UbiB family)
MLPVALCAKLGALHAAAPAHPPAATVCAIERAFGCPTARLFSTLEARPVGSGCIAQAHSMASHRIAWHGMAWRGVAWHGMAWHGIAWHGMA